MSYDRTKQKVGTIMRKIFLLMVALVLSVAMSGCLAIATQSLSDAESSDESSETASAAESTYTVGQKVTLPAKNGSFALTITAVEETDKRNEFTSEQPKHVILIKYQYENIDVDQDINLSTLSLKAYDSDGNLLETYPATESELSQNISAGGKTSACVAYGVDSDSKYIKLQYYNWYTGDLNDYARASCTFELTW